MIPSASRRAFLRGRRTDVSPWEQFCQRMRTAVAGTGLAHAAFDGESAPHACLRLAQASDIHPARRLCAEYGVTLALGNGADARQARDRPVLWVDPSPALHACQRLRPGGAAWFVQPGCPLGELDAAGLPGFGDLPAHLPVAAWLADRDVCNAETGNTARSGLSHASVLLDDGDSVVLGPFGAQQAAPLTCAAHRRLVSGLFSLVASEPARRCLAAAQWPARYRLDALCPRAGADINLAHVLAGHGGTLGWVEWLVFDERQPGRRACVDRVWKMAQDAVLREAAQYLDAQVKALFDPRGVFGV